MIAMAVVACFPTGAFAQLTAPMRYSIVCIIHGDGDYLYHDSSDIERVADVEALARMRTVAEHNPLAEVLIFHEYARAHTLLFFPQRDGEFFCYRGGRCVDSALYWRDKGKARFDPEVGLYQRFHVEVPHTAAKIFLYFGHEIPEFGDVDYDESFPAWRFTIGDLTDAMRRMLDTSRFDIVILSSCYSGTPHTIAALAPFARHIVASPDNLHLSYFNLEPLEHLESGARASDIAALTDAFVVHAFAQLSHDVQTAVTVASYDVSRTMPFLHYAAQHYDHTVAGLMTHTGESSFKASHCDCAESQAYAVTTMHDGVTVLYRPAMFGRGKHILTHSGWECWRERVWSIDDREYRPRAAQE